jgi:hypothetical protein
MLYNATTSMRNRSFWHSTKSKGQYCNTKANTVTCQWRHLQAGFRGIGNEDAALRSHDASSRLRSIRQTPTTMIVNDPLFPPIAPATCHSHNPSEALTYPLTTPHQYRHPTRSTRPSQSCRLLLAFECLNSRLETPAPPRTATAPRCCSTCKWKSSMRHRKLLLQLERGRHYPVCRPNL